MTQIVMVLAIATIVMCAAALLLAVATAYTVRNYRILKAMEARIARRAEPLARETPRPQRAEPRVEARVAPSPAAARNAAAAAARRAEMDARPIVKHYESAPSSHEPEYSTSAIGPGEWTGPVMPYTPADRETG